MKNFNTYRIFLTYPDTLPVLDQLKAIRQHMKTLTTLEYEVLYGWTAENFLNKTDTYKINFIKTPVK